jgi:hypothetical protein
VRSLRREDEERALASGVTQSRANLFVAMGLDPRASAASAETLAKSYDEASPEVSEAHQKYVEAINRFWLYAENAGITHRIATAWFVKNRRDVRQTSWSREDIGAEATLAMRAQVATFDPTRRGAAGLETYARIGIFRSLSEALGREMTAATGGLPRRQAVRTRQPDRVEMDDELAALPAEALEEEDEG